MSELFEKSMATLELPQVLALLADCAATLEGKERCLALRPLTDLDDVARAQEETSAAVKMLILRGSPGFSGVKPVSASLQRADMGGSLSTRELLDIASVLRCARGARDYGDSEEKTVISHLFRSLTPNRFLEDSITNSILSEEEIADSASSELASIRRHMRSTEARVRDILQRLISSNQSKYLQESIITIRSDRYVVPVKAEHKNAIPGLVHDVSSSGSTFFIEPMGVVKANNELRELAAREKKEIERILAELSAQCAAHKEDIGEDYTLLILLDTIFARGQLSLKMEASQPGLSERYLRLRGARHPLLDKKKAVANDLELGDRFDTLVITGPNTGGKTVTLKTLGLITLMAQCGLHIPAKSDSTVRVFRRVLSDIGDEQSIAQSLSTFSSHMTNIVGILKEADGQTLILFDELGAGTDPVEGAALAAAVIESARELGALVAATTHYAELKVYAMTTPGVENASCEFNVDTLAPTYRLVMGIPGKSNAFAISRRLGLPEEIIDRAAARLDAENVRFEDVLTKLDQQRQEMEKDRAEARRLKLEMEQSAGKAREYRKRLEEERSKVVEKAQAEARAIIQEARDASDLALSELKELKKRQDLDWQQVNDGRAEARRLLNEAERSIGGAAQEPEAPPPTRPARAGDTVELVSMGTRASVLSVNKDGTLQLQAGILKITAKQDEVRVVEGETQSQKEARRIVQRAQHTLRAAAAPSEIDLRGMMTDEAIAVLDRFLDTAMMGKLESVTIIHGKGTGAVRKAVREHLKRSRYIKSFRPGRYGEGEDGVTVAELR
ncbi:endonuclease MutS2 [Clostridium sp. DFI.5.61]|uniref:endonuclease MutS2 n=1 Tax=Eubacteriales TaxID=186802 RepID=UPI00210E28A1|nr:MULTISPECIES: endonuclease MutS2 [Eubacteriales]MCB5924921.1 endonuclease MutS2 [bacterium 210820-DFI.5.26]MCQ5160608.1 endonuclease MutS2 [Clostridium sp. DFI.5.61]MEE0111847.1 endonuclease MutS2 [Eubacteriales bacterium]UMM46089.1 endonuclease MutS2 [Lawsonibacter asaccharolyticus]